MDDQELLDTHMEAHDGNPEAVRDLLGTVVALVDGFPDGMRLSVELDVWEVGARDDD